MMRALTEEEIELVSGGHEVWTTIKWYNPDTGQWSEFKVLVPHEDWPSPIYA